MRTTVLTTAALAALCLLTPASTASSASPASTASKASPATPASTASASPAPPPAVRSGPAAPPRLGGCAPGELCLWVKPDFAGARQVHELSGIDIESCVPLPTGAGAQSLANRTGRPVTAYQSAECAETGEFDTYPGGGTWVPQSPYRVRAFKVWEN
ncbi:peptidase inhibitor family I36 protein [Streptomyces sp. WMMC940]|uniref:peptidase inhibitor family I36 protein n=1 Tax=Streptomyces sp. WMMC940 TaxID=3015153 RepID=UPI0022B6497B|nr:peptidase inhibitor family I36 protein [Streptomyces sp. WMMC940]MCZ7460473.1 peptidase inhibitor family I36 protein [Streptomyces sp. WMMC940]